MQEFISWALPFAAIGQALIIFLQIRRIDKSYKENEKLKEDVESLSNAVDQTNKDLRRRGETVDELSKTVDELSKELDMQKYVKGVMEENVAILIRSIIHMPISELAGLDPGSEFDVHEYLKCVVWNIQENKWGAECSNQDSSQKTS